MMKPRGRRRKKPPIPLRGGGIGRFFQWAESDSSSGIFGRFGRLPRRLRRMLILPPYRCRRTTADTGRTGPTAGNVPLRLGLLTLVRAGQNLDSVRIVRTRQDRPGREHSVPDRSRRLERLLTVVRRMSCRTAPEAVVDA